MGLLSWRRSPRGSERAPKAPGPTAPAARGGPSASAESAVIRADDLTRVPDWATLPPMAPVLPEMPFVVSRHFDDSLTSWQPPEQFLRPLGHSVSPAAPSGLVDGLLLLTPGPEDEASQEADPAVPSPVSGSGGPVAGEQPLILASVSPPCHISSAADAGDAACHVGTKPPRAVGSGAAFGLRRVAGGGTGTVAPGSQPPRAIGGWTAGCSSGPLDPAPASAARRHHPPASVTSIRRDCRTVSTAFGPERIEPEAPDEPPAPLSGRGPRNRPPSPTWSTWSAPHLSVRPPRL